MVKKLLSKKMKKVYSKINMDMLKCTTSAILTASDPQTNNQKPANDGPGNEYARGNGSAKGTNKLDLI